MKQLRPWTVQGHLQQYEPDTVRCIPVGAPRCGSCVVQQDGFSMQLVCAEQQQLVMTCLLADADTALQLSARSLPGRMK